MPGLQLSNEIGNGQEVEVAAHGVLAHAERARWLRRVPDLPMIVREHAPEPAHGGGRGAQAQGGQVALHRQAHEGLAPRHAVVLGGRKE